MALYLSKAPPTEIALKAGLPLWSLHSRPGLIVFVMGLAETLSFEERSPGSNEWILMHDTECELESNPDYNGTSYIVNWYPDDQTPGVLY